MMPRIFALALLAAAITATTTVAQTGTAARPWSERLTAPVTHPTTFESPIISTQIRPMVIHQDFPETSVFSGGNFRLYALQVRYAVTDRFAIIAPKDGFIDFNPGAGRGETGFADLAAGFKYAVIDDKENGLLVTPGLVYEIDSGNHDVFQGNGDGLLRPFVSAAYDMGQLNVLGTLGFNLPLHGSQETHSLDYHVHLDYEVTPELSPLIEVNGITYTSSSERLPFNFEGGDLLNLGSTDVAGQTVITGAIGARYRVNDNLLLGAAWEFPLTDREDLLDQRVTIDAIITW